VGARRDERRGQVAASDILIQSPLDLPGKVGGEGRHSHYLSVLGGGRAVIGVAGLEE
jgi:hypothetical protein